MTDQAPELREKMHNAVCKILTSSEICTDAGNWLCPQDVDGVNEMCADIVVAVLALTRPPSERPVAQVREALGWGQIVQIILRVMDHAPREATYPRALAEEIANQLLSRGIVEPALTAERPEAGMIQANSSASEKVCDHPSTEKAGWRDISSAPKDGTGILVTDARVLDWTQVVYFDEEATGPYVWARDDTDAHWHFDMFTHWMPLPAPPDGQVIAHPANSHGRSPESSEPSLLGRETVREETIEECAKIAESSAAHHNGVKVGTGIAHRIRALASLSPLKE